MIILQLLAHQGICGVQYYLDVKDEAYEIECMKLDQWLANKGWSKSEFARQCEVSPATVTRIMNGDRQPSAALIRKIAEVTKNKVTFNDWPLSPSPKDTLGDGAALPN